MGWPWWRVGASERGRKLDRACGRWPLVGWVIGRGTSWRGGDGWAAGAGLAKEAGHGIGEAGDHMLTIEGILEA